MPEVERRGGGIDDRGLLAACRRRRCQFDADGAEIEAACQHIAVNAACRHAAPAAVAALHGNLNALRQVHQHRRGGGRSRPKRRCRSDHRRTPGLTRFARISIAEREILCRAVACFRAVLHTRPAVLHREHAQHRAAGDGGLHRRIVAAGRAQIQRVRAGHGRPAGDGRRVFVALRRRRAGERQVFRVDVADNPPEADERPMIALCQHSHGGSGGQRRQQCAVVRGGQAHVQHVLHIHQRHHGLIGRGG